MTSAAIIVVNFGASALLEKNLFSTDEIEDVNVIVVDCFSSASERHRLELLAEARGWRTVMLPDNRGFGGGMNAGARAAFEWGADVIVALNPDARIDEAAVHTLVGLAAQNPDAQVWPRIDTSDGKPWFRGAEVYLDDGSMGGVRKRADQGNQPHYSWVTGACFAISRELWERAEGFDEDYFLYWEDVDFSVRVQRAGGRLLEAPVLVIHDEGQTHDSGQGARAKSETYYYYNIRNRLLFAKRHLDLAGQKRWRRAALRVSYGILLQGGRRQLLRTIAPWRALFFGMRDGARGTVGPGGPTTRKRPRPVVSRRVRLYNEVRTAHLERAGEFEPATILYLKQRYDFDDSLARGVDLVQAGPMRVIKLLAFSKIDVLEINEPLMLHGALINAAAVFVVRLRNRGRARIVTYAIENTRTFRQPRMTWKSRLRKRLEVVAARYLWLQLDSIAYGTEGAQEIYGSTFTPRKALAQQLVPALPAALPDVELDDRGPTVVFLGAFVERKGFPLVLNTWSHVSAQRADARLTLIGKGQMVDAAKRAAASDDSISLYVDPPRPRIREVLNRSRVLVLPSQPMPTWREQVGLPIVEGLENGCTIVTTAETGLASWLEEHGHSVVASDVGAKALAGAILAELDRRPRSGEILASLPEIDGRKAADSWLFRS